MDNLLSEKIYCNVYDILNLISTLSHDHSFVERGFTIKQEHLAENLQEKSLALCIVNVNMLENNLHQLNQHYKVNFDYNKFCRQGVIWLH